MPTCRIDLRKGKDLTYRQEIGRVVYEAMFAVGVGVPVNARFQVVSEHDADNFCFDPRPISASTAAMTWSSSRSRGTRAERPARRRRLYKAIVDGLGKAPGIRPEDVFINLVDDRKENWSIGKGEAQYAS